MTNSPSNPTDCYSLPYNRFSNLRDWPFRLVEDAAELNRVIAREAVDAIREAGEKNRPVRMILPVGPLDYRVWADLCNKDQISCEPLVGLSMDEYVDPETARRIARTNPLSFQRFIAQSLVEPLDPALRPNPENLRFPDPLHPQRTTEMVEAWGGVDICYGGMGITGHFAFNDPPEPGETLTDDEVRNSRTRTLTVSRESTTQMCMGGTNGNWSILPRRAVTLGMYELLLSRRIHLTFMRSWHAGVLRRALFGPVGKECPGSFVQDHPNVSVTLTRTASQLPMLNVAQATGE
jgi:glucosamine-6-phosphate deaminase